MKEPQRIPLDPTTPKIPSVKKIPMPALEETSEKKYPEPMSDDIYSDKPNDEGGAEQAFFNFIQKAKESKRKYNERLEKQSKDST